MSSSGLSNLSISGSTMQKPTNQPMMNLQPTMNSMGMNSSNSSQTNFMNINNLNNLNMNNVPSQLQNQPMQSRTAPINMMAPNSQRGANSGAFDPFNNLNSLNNLTPNSNNVQYKNGQTRR